MMQKLKRHVLRKHDYVALFLKRKVLCFYGRCMDLEIRGTRAKFWCCVAELQDLMCNLKHKSTALRERFSCLSVKWGQHLTSQAMTTHNLMYEERLLGVDAFVQIYFKFIFYLLSINFQIVML